MTFKEYVATQKITLDYKGDFLRVAMSDPDLPEPKTSEDLRAYVIKRHRSTGIAEGATDVWKAYQAIERRKK